MTRHEQARLQRYRILVRLGCLRKKGRAVQFRSDNGASQWRTGTICSLRITSTEVESKDPRICLACQPGQHQIEFIRRIDLRLASPPP